jgi:hypothetical protein
MYQQPQWPGPAPDTTASTEQDADSDVSRRPPNAFILYSQAMRSTVRQSNPALSNTEVSRLLGQLWKDVPADAKLQYKQQAARAQEQFKQEHPDYTYRKARRKRTLNELLTKTNQGYPAGFPNDPTMAAMLNPANAYMMQMYAQAGAGQGQGQVPGYPGMGMPMMPTPQGYPNLQGYTQLGDPNQNVYPYQPK